MNSIWWLISQALYLLVLYYLMRLLDFLLVTPLRLRSFYRKQGVNVKYWHPFHFYFIIKRNKQEGHEFYTYRQLFAQDREAKGFFIYQFFQPTVILNKERHIQSFLTQHHSLFRKSEANMRLFQKSFTDKNILFGEGAQWKKSRRLFHPLFGFESVKSKVADMLLLTEETLSPLGDGPVELIDPLSTISGKIIFSLFFGMDQEGLLSPQGVHPCLDLQEIIAKQFQKVLYISTYFLGIDRVAQGFFQEDRLLNARLEEVKQRIGDHLTKVISSLDDPNSPASKNEFMQKNKAQFKEMGENIPGLVEELIIFFVAGTDTTSHMVHNTLYEVDRLPEVKKKLLAEVDSVGEITYDTLQNMPYLEAVIKETLRFNSPASKIFPRERLQPGDLDLDGLTIKSGTMVDFVFMSDLLNERHFPEPMRFMPERWLDGSTNHLSPTAFAPFSLGPRSCIGEKMSMMEQKVILTYFLKHYSYSLPDEPVSWRIRFVLEPSKNLQFSLSRR